MKISEVVEVLKAKVICGEDFLEREIQYAFASDLMSDVLTLGNRENLLLITGLTNIQTIRTAEMADISIVLFVRNKKATKEIIKLAKENNMVIIECSSSMFKTSGILYNAGIKPVY